MATRQPALRYLMAELGIRTSDWQSLGPKDKEDLKQWAEEEQDALGIPRP